MVADTVNPARQADGVTNVFFGQSGTIMSAIGVHFGSLGLRGSGPIHRVGATMSSNGRNIGPNQPSQRVSHHDFACGSQIIGGHNAFGPALR